MNVEFSASEKQTLSALTDAWNSFLLVENLTGDELSEFRRGIHKLQNLVLARPVIRANRE